MCLITGKWEKELYPEFTKPYYREFYKECTEHAKGTPEPELMFRAFKDTPLETVKVAYIYSSIVSCHNKLEGVSPTHGDKFLCALRDYATSSDAMLPLTRQGLFCYDTTQHYKRTDSFTMPTVSLTRFNTAVMKVLARQEQPLVIILEGEEVQWYKSLFYKPQHLVLVTSDHKTNSLSKPSIYKAFEPRVNLLEQSVFPAGDTFLREHGIEPIHWEELGGTND